MFSPDGHHLVREFDAFDATRSFSVPDTGVIRIASSEPVIPLMTELLLANVLHERGRTVSIETVNSTAILIGEPRAALWVHVPRQE